MLSLEELTRNSTVQQSTSLNSSVQHGTERHSSEQHGTARNGTAQHRTARYSTSQHGTARLSTEQHSTARSGPAEHDTFWHSIAQFGTAQYGTKLHGITQQRSSSFIWTSMQRNPNLWAPLMGCVVFKSKQMNCARGVLCCTVSCLTPFNRFYQIYIADQKLLIKKNVSFKNKSQQVHASFYSCINTRLLFVSQV